MVGYLQRIWRAVGSCSELTVGPKTFASFQDQNVKVSLEETQVSVSSVCVCVRCLRLGLQESDHRVHMLELCAEITSIPDDKIGKPSSKGFNYKQLLAKADASRSLRVCLIVSSARSLLSHTFSQHPPA